MIICCWLRRAEKRRARSPVVKRGWTSLAPRAGFSQSYSQGDPQAGGVLIRSKASRVLTGGAQGL
ncbi:hypothetical protein XAP3CFBP6996_022155 [Xanthomonas citri pv. fuscans CFBP 6996]|nr:hypothetical protein XcvCFBP7112P_22245 [Xanthomonas citri pv. vignicola]ASL02756.1 hypothetical protein XcvCFBP7113P_22750 [Xanthomonas citri pv. vignicola]PTY28972.1 hypothetical protein XAP3CFBP6996_022155 [Xanthomonas citri pv. fuscans CFBP 6996]